MESLKVWGAAGAFALAMAALAPADSQAALLADGGIAGPVSPGTQTNDLIDDNTEGLFGAQIYLTNNNTGLIFGTTFVIGTDILSTLEFDDGVGGWLLPFAFATWEDTGAGPDDTPEAIAVNGDNNSNNANSDVNFWTSFGPSGTWGETGETGNRLVLMFDDNGAGDDDNHDDFAVEIAVTPLPAAAWFLITALGGLFGMRWLRGRNEA